MKLDLNSDNLIKQVAGEDLYKIYSGEAKEQTKEARQKVYDDKGINKKARGASSDQLKTLIAYAIYSRSLELCPEDTGRLKNTSFIRRFHDGYEIMYPMNYAPYVHEIPYYNHEYPTRYKFLEDAAIEIGTQFIKDKNFKCDIRINYNPLALYVGARTTLGESIWLIDKHIKDRDNKEFETFVYNKYLSGESMQSLGISEEDEEFLYNYIDYWTSWSKLYNRDIDDADLVIDWVDRIRHRERVSSKGWEASLQYQMFLNRRNSYM